MHMHRHMHIAMSSTAIDRGRFLLRVRPGPDIVPICPHLSSQFTKGQGVLANPAGGPTAPAKLRLAFEAAPFSLLVEKAGGASSDAVEGRSILDVPIGGIDQRTSLCIGSANEVARFNELVLDGRAPIPYAG